ncbi:hypothetical protein BDY19DRAFT_937422 [Irpex rosettiformis]|uniref:Uncharacterized protein n=1 Tax=Irpex rosettiformis TaxID=378272 RepID=A0ACB8U900_9APHY|nr:hypothetical protein BDY19DRAFT_937422 [Irpex rosettiformis]
MASLLERMSIPSNSVGPVRSKSQRSGTSSPYNRSPRIPKGDINGAWEHDLFDSNKAKKTKSSLGDRIGGTASAPPKVSLSMAEKALREAAGATGLTIKGASAKGNVVDVTGLADGTTSEDVEAIFKRCGAITKHELRNKKPVLVRLTYKNEKDAQAAVTTFNNQPADGRTLIVKIVGNGNATLAGRLGAPVGDSVDVLMDDSSSGSKLRSDDILAQDSRASVLVAPPGTNPKDYVQNPSRGRGRGRGGRGRGRGGKRGGGGRMDVD